MAKIPAGAWVLIGDGEKALFLRNDGDEAFPNLKVIREAHNASGADRTEATANGGGDKGGPSAPSHPAHSDFYKVEKEEFAHGIADRLYKAAHRGEYQALIVAAPPVVLGELRKALHKEVASRLLFDLAKELTNQPVDEIERALAAA